MPRLRAGRGYRSGTKGLDCGPFMVLSKTGKSVPDLTSAFLLYLALWAGVAADEKKALAKGYQMREVQ